MYRLFAPRLELPRNLFLPWISLLLVGLSGTAGAEVFPYLVKDIHPGAEPSASLPAERMLPLGPQLLMAAEVLSELDTTSGELVTIAAVHQPSRLTESPVVGQALFAGGVDGTLWRTDGTEGGTVEVSTVEVEDGFLHGSGLVFFSGWTATHGTELWRSDGTAGGTFRVTNLVAGSGSSDPYLLDVTFTVEGDPIVYFSASSDALGGREPWRYSADDGSVVSLGDLNPGVGGSSIDCIDVLGQDVGCPKLSHSAGPILVRAETSAEGMELWSLSAAGATLVMDIEPGTGSSYPGNGALMTDGGARLVFEAETTAAGRELWVTDGTPGGTEMVVDLAPGPDDPSLGDTLSLGSRVVFSADHGGDGQEVWVTDGTAPGTFQLVDLLPGSDGSDPSFFGVFDGVALFTAYTGKPFGGGSEQLWMTDGTVPGTVLLEELVDGGDGPVVGWGGLAYFWLGTPSDGAEVWRTNLSPETTEQVSYYASTNESVIQIPSNLYSDRQTAPLLFYAAADNGFDPELEQLWGTDGTVAGTQLLGEYQGIPQIFSEALGLKFGRASTSGTGLELLVSDGTPEGTELIDIVPGSSGSFPGIVREFEGLGYFQATSPGGHGNELWVTDGTAAGTQLFLDLNPGSGSSSPGCFTELAGELYFCARDQLWKTDGTVPGTVLVADGNPGGTWSLAYFTRFVTSSSQELLVFIGRHPTFGDEVWISDGTGPGTMVLVDANPGAADGANRSSPPVVADGKVFLSLDDGTHGYELWVTDGSVGGTGLLKDVWPGPNSGYYGYGSVVGSSYVFGGYDPASGSEPWVSDGTPGGTGVLLEIGAGSDGSGASFDGVVFDGRVWFRADPLLESQAGRVYEIWSTDGTPGGTQFELVFHPSRIGDPDFTWAATDELLFLDLETEEHGRTLYSHCSVCDYGDAADSPYPTVIASTGARHRLSSLHLGDLVDAEPEGRESGDTEGDDDFDTDDEDGVVLPLWVNVGYPNPIGVTASEEGRLDAWIDSDGDGVWEEGDERLFADVPLTAGSQELSWVVPTDFSFGLSHVLRFRISRSGGLGPTGHAVDGEVEDHEWTFLDSGAIFLDGFESGNTSQWDGEG